MDCRYLWTMVSWQLLCFVQVFGACVGSQPFPLGFPEASQMVAEALGRALWDYWVIDCDQAAWKHYTVGAG